MGKRKKRMIKAKYAKKYALKRETLGFNARRNVTNGVVTIDANTSSEPTTPHFTPWQVIYTRIVASALIHAKYVVAMNAALVLWAAGIEDDLHEGFKKALISINQGYPWKKFLLLKTYLSTNESISNL